MSSWADHIAHAERTGEFTVHAKTDAGTWNRCAVSERSESWILCPALQILGLTFFDAVRDNQLTRAKTIYRSIHAHAHSDYCRDHPMELPQ